MSRERLEGEYQADQPVWYVQARKGDRVVTWGPFYVRRDAEKVVNANPKWHGKIVKGRGRNL